MILSLRRETTGLDFFHGCKPFLITACDGDDNYYWEGSVNPYTREVFWEEDILDEVQSILNKCSVLVMHNTQFDMRALESIGLKIEHLWDKIEDTLLASHALCSGDSHNLKDLSIKYLNLWDDDEKDLDQTVKSLRPQMASKGWQIAKKGHPHFPALKGAVNWFKMDMWLAPDECLKYGIRDAERTWLLWDAFKVGLTNESLWAPYKLRKKLLKICYDMTTGGMRLNVRATNEYIELLETKMLRIRKYIENELGIRYKFNWNKRDHLISLLHNHLKIPQIYDTPKGGPATDKKALGEYFLSYKSKLLNALMKGRAIETRHRYVLSYKLWTDDNGYIHSNTNVTGTRETRQSSTSPNQQNITGKLKELFQPPPGSVWVDIDFVNIELRIWAFSVGNKELMDAFDAGRSVHEMIMETLYPREFKIYKTNPNEGLKKLYRGVKGGTFARIYGATEKKADETYGYAGATAKINARFPGIEEFTQSLIRQCEENRVYLQRHAVMTLGGYLLDVPTDEPFKAGNYYIQGSAGMITSKAMIAVVNNDRFIDSGSQLVTQVHDSIKPQIPIHKGLYKTVQSITKTMETCAHDIFGDTPVSYEVIYHPDDKNNPHLQELLLGELPF
jgi:DNA polymerase I-like protein with 3'-5' exonuclease and polymerase domains